MAGLLLLLLLTSALLDAGLTVQGDSSSVESTPAPTFAIRPNKNTPVQAAGGEPVTSATTTTTPASATAVDGQVPEALALRGTEPLLAAEGRGVAQDDDDDDEEYEEYEDGDDIEEGDEDPDLYDDEDEDEYEDGDGDDDDRLRDDEDDDDDYGEDEDEKEGAGDGAPRERVAGTAHVEAEDDDEVREDALVRERRDEVRSLRDLPLSKLLRVQTELRRLTGHPSTKRNDQCNRKKQKTEASRRWLTGVATPDKTKPSTVGTTAPNAQPFNWGGGKRKGPSGTTPPPVRRAGDRGGDRGGGWSSHESWEEEEEEEEDAGWISWHKGNKKKGKGDIGSIFQISVTFLAFLAFGGYLLCLIMQAIKGGGYWNGYGYGYGYYPNNNPNGQLRPSQVMMLVMPNRNPVRRPTRPASGVGTGRRRREVTQTVDDEGRPGGLPEFSSSKSSSWSSWVPSFGEEDIRILPQMDVDRMHRALLVLAEGYASFYHKRYFAHPQ